MLLKSNRRTPVRCATAALLVVAGVAGPEPAHAADLLDEPITHAGGVLHLKTVADLGSDSLISITHQPNQVGLFVTTQTGQVYEVDAAGNATAWFDYNAAIAVAKPFSIDGYKLTTTDANHGGLRAIAFHPEFANNGLFYTSAAVAHRGNDNVVNYLGTSTSNGLGESAVVEWRYDFAAGQVDANTHRELFRVRMPEYDHPIKQIAFNPYAEVGDEDYGLLYIAHGDGSVQSAIAGGGLVTTDALGKVLRIDPRQSGDAPYTTPNNPFNDDPNTLDEIYTLGHRNPHNLSFALDEQGNSHVIVAEIGRDNIEEINILQSGGNYGWSDREGTFVHLEGGGYITGVEALPDNEWELNDHIYPAVQYGHDTEPGAGFVGSAVVGGFVLDHADYAALDNQYIFADFGTKTGHLYQADWAQMLAAHTQLADFELPSTLTQAQIHQLLITLDTDGDGNADRAADNLNTLFQVARNDVRFGQSADGLMYLTSKKTGKLYLVTGASANYGKAPGTQLILNESFAYEDGELAGNDDDGLGWSGAWVGGHEVIDGELFGEDGALASRPFLGHEPGQTLYFSVEMTTPQEPAGSFAAWLQIDDNAYDDSNDGVQLGIEDWMFTIGINGPGNADHFGNFAPGETVSIVGKLVFNADGENEQLTAWINPTGVESAEFTSTITADLGFTLAQSVELRALGSDNEQVLFDHLRVGTRWTDVSDATLVAGDTDGDGDIDDIDLGTSFANYTGPVGAAGGKALADGDTDGDGDVDDIDLGTFFAGYTGPLTPNPVPEPTTLVLLALGGPLGTRRDRRAGR